MVEEGRDNRLVKQGLIALASVACLFSWMPSLSAIARPVRCSAEKGDGKSEASGNRLCSSAKERDDLMSLADGPWKQGECGVRVPVTWESFLAQTEKDESTVIMGMPSEGGRFSSEKFRLEVSVLPPLVHEEAAGQGTEVEEESIDQLLKEDLEGDGSVAPPLPKPQVEMEATSAGSPLPILKVVTPIDSVRIRYLTQYPDNGEVMVEGSSVKQAHAAVDHDGSMWKSSFLYEGKSLRNPPKSVFSCIADDKMSIETFSLLCTLMIESMTLRKANELIGACKD